MRQQQEPAVGSLLRHRPEARRIAFQPAEEDLGFDLDGATFMPAERRWLQGEPAELLIDDPEQLVMRATAKDATPALRLAHFDIPLVEIQRQDSELDYMREMDILVVTRILGLSTTQVTLARHGYPDVLGQGVDR